MEKHIQHNKDERHSSLEKYTSHFIERVVCERELETEQICNILTPTLQAIIAFLSCSPVLLNHGPRDSASLLRLQLLNRGPEGPLCLVMAFSTASCLQLIWSPNWLTSCLYPGYIMIWRPFFFLRASQFRTHSTRPRSRL